MILIEENVYVIVDEKVIDECQQGNNCSKEQSICQDPLHRCEYEKVQLEKSQFNSSLYIRLRWTEEGKRMSSCEFSLSCLSWH